MSSLVLRTAKFLGLLPLLVFATILTPLSAAQEARPEEGGHEIQLWTGGGYTVPGGTKDTGGDGELTPNDGRWQKVAVSSDVPDGVMHPFDLGSVIGFVRRVNGKPEAVSGVCTHQGCRLWFDAPDDRLRCPCHSTSFAPTGQVLTHQLPIAPAPLPALQVREANGVIEVLAPTPEQPT